MNYNKVLVSTLYIICVIGIAFAVVTGTTIEQYFSSDERGCTTHKTSMDHVIDQTGRLITVCNDERWFILFPTRGHSLRFSFAPRFIEEYEHRLEGRSVGDFVSIDAPGTFSGSIVDSWRIIPKDSGYNLSGLDNVVLHVRAVSKLR